MPVFDLEADWRTRADDILIWGASLVGASKYYYSLPVVQYRVHGQNSFFNRKITENELIHRCAAIEMFFLKFRELGKDISRKRLFKEMQASSLPFYYYLPYLYCESLYRKVLMRICSLFKKKNEKFTKIAC